MGTRHVREAVARGQAVHVTHALHDTSPAPTEVAASLHAVLAAVDTGEISADDAQRAYIAGAAEALESLMRPLGDRSKNRDLR
jgi:hypothetical protein